jgi:simple sugar transport system ATP-binding protein
MDLARQGCAVMIISQDLDELLALCNRLGVLYGGRLSEVRPVRELNRETIGLAMGGAMGQALWAWPEEAE